MASFFARSGPGELLARYSFLEPLLEGRRVLEIGAAAATDGASALVLADKGAAAVLSIEPDEKSLAVARTAGHHPFVRYEATRISDLKPATFDLILVADGADLARQPARISELKRLLTDGGWLVAGLAAPEGRTLADLAGHLPPANAPSYEAFVGALTEQFPSVEVATLSPLTGFALVLPPENGGEPEISVDLAHAGDPAPSGWVAICGDDPSWLSGLLLAAVPSTDVLEAAAATNAAAAAASSAAQDATAEARRLVAENKLQLETAHGAVASSEAARAALEAERIQLTARLAALTGERDGLMQDRQAALAAEAEVRHDLQLAKAAHADAQAGREDQSREAQRLRTEVATARAEAALALERFKAEITGAVERLRGAEAEADAERAVGQQLRAELERVGQALALRERELSDARVQGSELQRRLGEAELEAMRVGEERTRAVTELAGRVSGDLETQATLQAARSEAQAARSALESALHRADQAEGRLQALEVEVEERMGQLRVAHAEIEVARQMAGQVRAESAAAVEARRAELESARGEALQVRAERDRLREEAITSRSESEVAHRELDGLRVEAARAAKVQEELRRELAETRGALELKRRELEGAGPARAEHEALLGAARAEAERLRQAAWALA